MYMWDCNDYDWSNLRSGHVRSAPLEQARMEMEIAWKLYYDACDSHDRSLLTERLLEAQDAERRYNQLYTDYARAAGVESAVKALLDDDPTAETWLAFERQPQEIYARARRVSIVLATRQGMDAAFVLRHGECTCMPLSSRACLFCRTWKWWNDKLDEMENEEDDR